MIPELVGSRLELVLGLLWALGMIAVPVASLAGRRGRASSISVAVVLQVALVVAVLFRSWGTRASLLAVVAVPAIGWLAEFIGSRTGVPFGRYEYTDLLQPQLHRVPVLIPLAWLMMMPPSWATAQLLLPEGPWWMQAVVAGYAFMAWDVYLDPQLTRWKFWEWDQPGRYEGIPLVNFAGWFLVATLISGLVLGAVAPLSLPVMPLVLIYLVTWILQFGGHLVFWRWPVSAAAGLLAMGLVGAPALWVMFG